MPPSITSTKDFKAEAAEAPETEPGVPPTPVDLADWLEEQVKLGLMQPQALIEFRQANGLPAGPLPAARSSAPTAAMTPRSKELDQKASEQAWRLAYEAYATSGYPEEIAALTGLELNLVKHLLSYGVRRLGLKPIREAAVDYAEAALRTEQLVKAPDGPQHLVHLAEAREASTERVARESAAAQGLLISSLKTADSFLGYVNKVLQRSQDADGYQLPEQITPSLLAKLAYTANKLAGAVDKAVRLSRFTAGEPDRNELHEITVMVGRMSQNEDDLREYLSTGRIPQHLRIKGSNFIDAEFDHVASPPPAPPLPPRGDEEE